MHARFRSIFPLLLAALLAAPTALHAQDLNSVLAQLNAAAKRFHNTSASFVMDAETQDPVPDSDIQKGVVYYERAGSSFKMAAHVHERNNHPVHIAYNFSGGVVHYFDGTEVNSYQASKWQSYLTLGFGASGTDLADKWNIKYLGSSVMDGVKVAELELAAKDPQVRKTIPKVTLWIDPERGVSVQQRFDEGPGLYRICKYTDIKVNESLPSKAFDLQ